MRDLVVVGPGQLGQLFAGGALRLGYRVTPVRRGEDPAIVAGLLERGTPLLVTTGEDALPGILGALPAERREDCILVQNELFPSVWTEAGAVAPTVAVVWFSKKPGRPVEVARPTDVYGRFAELVAELHAAVGLEARVLDDAAALDRALVAKFAFILTINALGLVEDKTVGAWLQDDPDRVASVLDDALRLGEARLGRRLDVAAAGAEVQAAMRALAHYPARGRTAALRVQRARTDAAALGVTLRALPAPTG